MDCTCSSTLVTHGFSVQVSWRQHDTGSKASCEVETAELVARTSNLALPVYSGYHYQHLQSSQRSHLSCILILLIENIAKTQVDI